MYNLYTLYSVIYKRGLALVYLAIFLHFISQLTGRDKGH